MSGGSFELTAAGGLLFWKCEVGTGRKFTAAFASRVALRSEGPALVDYGFAGDPDAAADARRNLCRALSLDFEKLTFGAQVHGSRIADVTPETAGSGAKDAGSRIPDTDALVTDVPGVTLGVMTADCVPLLLADPVRGVAAAIHAGWRSMLSLIIEKTAERLREKYNSRPGDILAFIGPAIGPCCFEIGEDVAGKVPGDEKFCLETRGGSVYLDLRRLARVKLDKAGVGSESAAGLDMCTRCHTELFFSYRGDKGTPGSNVSVIGLAD